MINYAIDFCRKKKKSKAKPEAEKEEKVHKLLQSSDVELVSPPSRGDSPAATSSSRKTEAERRFDEVQKQRVSSIQIPRHALNQAAGQTSPQASRQDTQGPR